MRAPRASSTGSVHQRCSTAKREKRERRRRDCCFDHTRRGYIGRWQATAVSYPLTMGSEWRNGGVGHHVNRRQPVSLNEARALYFNSIEGFCSEFEMHRNEDTIAAWTVRRPAGPRASHVVLPLRAPHRRHALCRGEPAECHRRSRDSLSPRSSRRRLPQQLRIFGNPGPRDRAGCARRCISLRSRQTDGRSRSKGLDCARDEARFSSQHAGADRAQRLIPAQF